MLSPTTIARQTVLTALKAASAVTDRIPAARLYPTKTPSGPTLPFGRYGSSTATPSRASCQSGGVVAGSYHVFAGQSSAILDPATFVGDTVDVMASVIDGIENAFVDRTAVMPDPDEADVWHGIVFFTFEASEAA